jgi:acetolactate synthase-1/2/3 large subunit
MKIRVADYISNFLVQKKITDIFVLTGYGAMYLNDAIASNAKINYFCVRNEASSPMMAEAYSRLKNSVGAVCLTAGPGSTNAIPGLAEAWVDSAAVMIFSGQVQKNHTTYVSNIPGLRSFGTAEINIVPIVKPLTKYAEMIIEPNTIKYHLEKAYYLATSGRPGPVWLDVPQDVQNAMINTNDLEGFKTPTRHVNIDFDKVDMIAYLLGKAKRPLIVAGQGVRISKSIKEFGLLTKKLRVPVVLARLGVDLLPYSNEFNMGLGGIRGNKFANSLMKSSDFVLVLGARLSVPFVGQKLDAFGSGAKIAVVDIEEAELKKPGVKIDIAVNCDLKPFIPVLMKKLADYKVKKQWLLACQRLKARNPMVTNNLKKNPINLYYFMSVLDEQATAKNILVTDSGSNYYIGGQAWKFNKGQREITSGAFGAMGLSIPLAIGASIADKTKQVLAVTGDGSLELNIQELKTMSYYNLDIKLFVINNGGYVSMRRWQDTFFEGRRIGSDAKTGVPILNLKNVAKAFDLDYDIIDKWQDIESKIKKIMSKKGPLFIEVVCDSKQKLINPLNNLGILK